MARRSHSLASCSISVVRTDEHLAVNLFNASTALPTHSSTASTAWIAALNTGMANHIRICKVDDDNIIFLGTNSIRQLVAYFVSTHLRLQVISSNLRGFYKDSILTFIWLLNAAIEEEGYMCLFLGLSTCA